MNRIHVVTNFLALVFLALVLIVLASPIVSADDKTFYDRVNLSVEAVDEVENDTLVAVLYAQREGSNLAELSNEVNRAITQAIQRSKKAADIDVQTLAYQTFPVYQKQRLSSWRVRQSIQLKSRNIKALSALLGDLQSHLALESIRYTVSNEQRAGIEEALIGKAITAFQQRARNITKQLGRKKYRLVTMDVRTHSAAVRPALMRGFSAAAETKVAPPAIEPGTQTVTISASGVIELVVN